MHHRLCSTAAPMVHESIEFKQQLLAAGSVGTSFQPCDHHSNGLLPPQRCVKTSSCSASPFPPNSQQNPTCWQTCTGSELCEPPHLPRCTHKSKLRASKHFPQTIILWCFETAGGISQLSGALSLEISTVQWPGPAQSRAAPAIQGETGLGLRGMAPDRHSSACMEMPFFPLFCQQAGRGGPKEAVSPVHLVLHQFINSKIKMGKRSGERLGEYKAMLWLQFAPHQSSSQAQLEMCPWQSWSSSVKVLGYHSSSCAVPTAWLPLL